MQPPPHGRQPLHGQQSPHCQQSPPSPPHQQPQHPWPPQQPGGQHPQPPQQHGPPRKRGKAGLIIGLVGGLTVIGVAAAVLIAFFVFDVGQDDGPVAGIGETFEIDGRLITVLGVESGIQQISTEHSSYDPGRSEFFAVDIHMEYVGEEDQVRWSTDFAAVYQSENSHLANAEYTATGAANPQDHDSPPFQLSPGEEGTMRVVFDVYDSDQVNYLSFRTRNVSSYTRMVDLNGPIHN